MVQPAHQFYTQTYAGPSEHSLEVHEQQQQQQAQTSSINEAAQSVYIKYNPNYLNAHQHFEYYGLKNELIDEPLGIYDTAKTRFAYL